MPNSPHDALAAALASRGAAKHLAMDLGSELSAWLAWARSHACPTAEAAGGYLDHLIGKHGPSGARTRFATLQIAAAYTWGPHETRHLAAVMRGRLVTQKPARATGAAAFDAERARLPAGWRPSFDAVIATHLKGKGLPGAVHWSATRIRSVMSALAAWHAFRSGGGDSPVPSGGGFDAWARALTAADRQGGPVSAVTVETYLSRVLDGYSLVISPGFRSTACRLVIDDWAARAESEPSRRNRTSRMVGASTLFKLGLDMVDEAMASPVIGLAAARTCRNGVRAAACLPQRARALSRLVFDETLFLEPDFTIRIFLPAAALKMRETKKNRRKPFAKAFRNPRLWTALDTWRRVFRPLYDRGDWLFPSRLDVTRSISESHLGEICRTETLARLKIAVSIHDIRGNVATEASEHMEGGALTATALLGHRNPKTTRDHYDQSEDLRAAREHDRFIEALQTAGPALLLQDDDDADEAGNAPENGPETVAGQRVPRFRSPPLPSGSAASAAGG